MKPTTIKPSRIFFRAITVVAISLVLISWNEKKQAGDYRTADTDSIPKAKTEKKIVDLDDVMDELNRIDLKEQLEKVRVEMQEAFKNLDTDKIRLEVDKAMKEIDMVKIQKELKESLAKVDFTEMEKELQKAREEMKELGPKLEKEMEKVREEMKELGPKLEKELSKAKVEIEKAKTEVREYQEFVDGLEKDGLLNKKENYTISHKNGELTVNGKKVSAEVYNKYKTFLEKHKSINIEKSPGNFSIDNDD